MLKCSRRVSEVAHPFSGDGAVLIHWGGQDLSYFLCTAPLEKVHRGAWIYPIHSWVVKTLSKIYRLLILFVYLLCSFNKNPEMQIHLERGTPKEHQRKGSVCRQKMHKAIKWLAYNPKISQGQGQNQGCTRATTFIYPHTILPLASFRRFELLSGFLRKTMAEQNKDSWISVSGHRMLGLAATLVQYLLQLLPGESVFAEYGSNSFCKTKYCTFDRYGWQFFLSSKHWQRVQGAPLRPRLTTFCSHSSEGLCSAMSCSVQSYWNFLPFGHHLCPVKAKHSASPSWEADGLFRFTQGPTAASQQC